MQKEIYVNNRIRAEQIRLIDETGKQIGVLPLQEALAKAQEKNLDLIQVTDKVVPPVCRIGDYGKYLYQLQKKERHEKKGSGGELKETRLTFNISTHDMETRANQAIKFLTRGDKVRITVRLRGREKALRAFTEEKIRSFLGLLEAKIPVKIEQKLQVEPRGLSMIVTKK